VHRSPRPIYSHPADLVNVVNGLISHEMVNAHDAVNIGNGELVSFEKSWPNGYSFIYVGIVHGSEKKGSKVWEQSCT